MGTIHGFCANSHASAIWAGVAYELFIGERARGRALFAAALQAGGLEPEIPIRYPTRQSAKQVANDAFIVKAEEGTSAVSRWRY